LNEADNSGDDNISGTVPITSPHLHSSSVVVGRSVPRSVTASSSLPRRRAYAESRHSAWSRVTSSTYYSRSARDLRVQPDHSLARWLATVSGRQRRRQL